MSSASAYARPRPMPEDPGAAAPVAFDDALVNRDLAPTEPARRTWGVYDYAALWVGMTHQVPTYLAASGLIALGMNWWQALLTIGVANVLILIPILLNAHIGARYGIPFPVVARASYGVRGANLAAIMRALVACGWYGIQAWIGGQAVNQLVMTLYHPWATFGGTLGGQSLGMWIAFAIFWLLNVGIVYRGMEALRRFENWAGPSILVIFGAILAYFLVAAHGLGPVLAARGKFTTPGAFLPVFLTGVASMMGMWATLSLNIPDFTRYARDQRAQMIGQAVTLPTTMTLFAAMGVFITSAAAIVRGKVIWDPVQLIGSFHNPLVVVVSMAAIIVLTLSVNVAANVVSPAFDISNILPRRISFQTGGVIAAVLAVVIRPWALLSSPTGFIFTFLNGYGGGLGSIAGVMIADYWLVQRAYHVSDLYRRDGRYRFFRGWNWRAVVATAAGAGLSWVGWWIPALKPLTNYAWFVGFAVGLGLHWLLCARFPAGVREAGA